MARSVIDVLVDNLEPQAVSNVLYECMLDWRELTTRMRSGKGKITDVEMARLLGRRLSMERILGRFFGLSQSQMNRHLARHFDIRSGS